MRRVLLVVVCAGALAGPAAAGPPPITPGQRACFERVLGKAVVAKLLRGGKEPSAAQMAKLTPCFAGSRGGGTGSIPTRGAWITANPLDLSVVTAMSTFRSCSGHDYSGLDVEGQRETERSMKHYVVTSVPWQPADSISGYAPFDGTVTGVESEQFPLGRQVQITASGAGSPWIFVFFHADLLVKAGDRVKAAQPVVKWPPASAASLLGQLRPALSFDVALKARGPGGDVYDSPLLHMTPAVLAQFTARGLTPAKLIVPKAARDAAPCTSYNNSDATDFVSATPAP